MTQEQRVKKQPNMDNMNLLNKWRLKKLNKVEV